VSFRWLLLAVAAIASAAPARPPITPPGLDAIFLADLPEVHEAALWPERAQRRFNARYRLTVMGIACRSYLVRMDQNLHGDALVTVKSWNRCKRDEPYSERVTHIPAAEMVELEAAARRARLWETSPQFWRTDDDAICVDGEEMIFERLITSGYSVAQANAHCEAPGAIVLVARTIFELAREKGGLGLLPQVIVSNDR